MKAGYLNHAGTSYPKSPEVSAAVTSALRAEPETWPALYEEAAAVIEREFSTQSDFQIRLTTGCTAALSLALQGLTWSPGQLIVTSSLEHHALDREARALEINRGVVRRVLSYSPHRGMSTEQLQKELMSGDVHLIAITHASNITGDVLPLHEVAALAHEAGALLLVDAAQTFGTDLFREAVSSADLIVAAGHKWAGGPQGIGVLAARAGVRFSCPSAICEVGEKSASFPSFCDAGSVNLAGALGLATALRQTSEERRKIGQRMRALADQLRQALTARPDVHVLGGVEPALRTPVVSFVMEHIPLEKAQTHFLSHGLVVRVGTHCAPLALGALGAEAGCIRVSFGASSTSEDVQRVISACDGAAR